MDQLATKPPAPAGPVSQPETTIMTGKKDASAQSKAGLVNILVVDDLPEKLLVYETVLSELGQNLFFARSGEEALKLVLRHEFAVILLDVNMPDMDGFEVADMIRQRRKSSRVPIIFLTAFSDDINIAQGYASGAVDYLPTPVVPDILRAKVKVFIELFQMRQQAAIQAEEQARRTAIEEAAKRKDEFLGMLAHELRNPLGPARNAVYLLRKAGPNTPELDELRDIIDRQVTHMARLIDDLLDTTRLARGQVLLRTEPCNLVKIVHRTVEDYRSIFEASGLILEVDTPSQQVIVKGDPTRLVQIVGNLLHNAHKFTDPGGTVHVSLEHDSETGKARILVKDEGIGIEPELLPAIFDVFRQAQQGLDRSRGGLGLGLSLVRGLVELHQGEVTAYSKGCGHGTTFAITLPLSESPLAASVAKPANLSPEVKNCRILIIEDDKDTANTTCQILISEGYEVKIANSGSDGLATARTFQPHIILCDIGLPEMSGYDVVKAIRKDKNIDCPFIIAVTGYGRDEDQRAAQNAGFDAHLTKPIDFNAMRRTLAASLSAMSVSAN